MKTQQILQTADGLSQKLSKKEVKRDYIEQVFRYVLDQQKRKDEIQSRADLKKLVSNMKNSGFEKRSKSTENQYKNAAEILENFKIQESQNLLDASLDNLIKILGYTVRLMRYYETKKGDRE